MALKVIILSNGVIIPERSFCGAYAYQEGEKYVVEIKVDSNFEYRHMVCNQIFNDLQEANAFLAESFGVSNYFDISTYIHDKYGFTI